MNSINKQALLMYKVTEADFRNWCKTNKKNVTSMQSRQEFFKLLQEKKLVKKGSKLILKN